jgi:RNA polymerase sigma-70 factor (ECF subfamily)
MAEDTTMRLQRCLDRLHAGNASARDDLISAAATRLNRLARKMFHAEGRLRQWQDTGDIFQGAMVRLCRALAEVTPGTLREFFRLAALQVRRELIDLARHYYSTASPHVVVTGSGSSAPAATGDPADSTLEPSHLATWSEFHEQIGALPDEEREVFDLVWYQGLTHAQAAAFLGVSTKTIQRRWQASCLRLYEVLEGQLPGA